MVHSFEVHGPAQRRSQEYLIGWQRARAELLNYRQRMQRQQLDMAYSAQRQAIESILAIADSLQAVAKHVPAEIVSQPWTQGVLHVVRQLEQIIAGYNLEAINQVETTFDPAVHEVVGQVSVDKPSGTVVEIVSLGYKFAGKVIRPAKVKVAT